MTHELFSIDLHSDRDVVSTRQRARELAAMLGFKPHDQTSLATAVSEISRHVQRAAMAASVTFLLRAESPAAVIVKIIDLAHTSSEPTDAVITARRLVDEYALEARSDGSALITIAKRLPARSPPVTPEQLQSLRAEISRNVPRDPVVEVQQQNRELLAAFEELQKRQAEVERLNAELAETNRGVLALYAELDEKAESLRRASEHKSRFVSDVTHELRTPLNAMISLSQLLLDRADGELTAEQERQVSLIYRSASSLNEMVSDLLDIARIEAGKEEIRISNFVLPDLLGALRGVFRPLTPAHVKLEISEPEGVLSIESDERKLTQILRNLLSNAIKFTQSGDVTLRTRVHPTDPERVQFAVTDTGIGLAADDLGRIFADFAKVDGPLQRNLRGTGLGLPLTRKLARLLGGDVEVASRFGQGSTFTVTLPRKLTVDRTIVAAGLSGAAPPEPPSVEGGVEGDSRG